MIRYRLAQSNAWVYCIQKTIPDHGPYQDRKGMVREVELELQAWIMKMDKTREFMPSVSASELYDTRNRQWRISATWVSPHRLHEGETT